MEYDSTIEHRAQTYPGVSYRISRMSLGRRIDLGERAREISNRGEFLRASSDGADQVEAALLDRQVEKLYLEWGLLSVDGLFIDGVPATPASVIDHGPEDLTREILTAIRAELGLSEAERKN
ncbi:MAG: hypothetical protein R2762_10375 [Bryobacteraceae bacterium]